MSETIGLFAPGLSHARALYDRLRDEHQAEVLADLDRMQAQAERLSGRNESLTRTVEAQQALIAELLEENARLRKRSWFRR